MRTTLDLGRAKNALFIRQSVAVAFGIPLDRELTWAFLHEAIWNRPAGALPECLVIRGYPSRTGTLAHEYDMLSVLLQGLRERHGVTVQVEIHD